MAFLFVIHTLVNTKRFCDRPAHASWPTNHRAASPPPDSLPSGQPIASEHHRLNSNGLKVNDAGEILTKVPLRILNSHS